jgi:hypothetical protein
MAQLTFGVEIEGILAFHYDKLQEFIDAHLHGASIVKELSPEQESCLRSKRYTSGPYNSWALSNAGENKMTISPTASHPSGPIRAYKSEPLHILLDLLSSKGGKPIHLHYPEDHSKPAEYKDWTLTFDDSIISLTHEEKTVAFPQLIPTTETENWDSYGFELVSPPYLDSAITQAHHDISSMIAGLATPKTGMAANATCGVHVHIGLPSSACLPTKVVQHLAYLVVVYEDEISRLHPAHRRQRVTEIESNRLNFCAEGDDPRDRCESGAIDESTGEIQIQTFQSVYKALGEIRRVLFEEADRTADPVRYVVERMGRARGYAYNFSALVKREGPKTVEFRQHAGSIDAGEIQHWIGFCVGLVALASRYAAAAAGTTDGCKVQHWGDRVSIEDLWEEMGLEAEGRQFYREKMALYAVGAPESYPLWEEVLEDDLD